MSFVLVWFEGPPAPALLSQDGVAFAASRAEIGCANNLMPKLLFTDKKGKLCSATLLSTSNSQRPNEIQTRDLDQIYRILPPHILSELSARGITIPPHETALLLSHLKAAPDADFRIGD